MKRKTRKMPNEIRKKISEKMRGKQKTEKHKNKISIGMKKYWATIPVNEDKEDML